MVFELKNIKEIENSFINVDDVINELTNNPFAKYLILKEQNKIIGYLYYSEIYDRIEINQFEIEKNHRNCGKGTKLLKKLTTSVDKNITLEVREDNIEALTLYKKFEFKQIAIRKGYYNGIDAILMERKND